jgi:predicted lipid-binding transport protein (Tim44 family)
MNHDGDVIVGASSSNGAEEGGSTEREEILSGWQRMVGYLAGGALGGALAVAVLILIVV